MRMALALWAKAAYHRALAVATAAARLGAAAGSPSARALKR